MAMHFLDRAIDRGALRAHEGVRGLRRARRGDRLRLPRGGARRALAPPGDPRRQDRQLPPVPADAVERAARPTPTARRAPTRTRSRASRSSRRTARTTSAGIDIMRAVRSFDPCLPCGVHMYLGGGATLRTSTRRCSVSSTDEPRSPQRRSSGCSASWRSSPTSTRATTALGVVQALLELYGEGLGRIVEASPRPTTARWPRRWPTTSWWRTCCCCTACTRCPSSGACARRSTGCGPTWSPTAATSSCRRRATASCGCGWRAAARAARRRR